MTYVYELDGYIRPDHLDECCEACTNTEECEFCCHNALAAQLTIGRKNPDCFKEIDENVLDRPTQADQERATASTREERVVRQQRQITHNGKDQEAALQPLHLRREKDPGKEEAEMTCASCTALKLLENHRTGEMEHYCLTWLRFQDPDADACRNCQPDHGEQVITQEMALAMVVGA